MWLSLNWFIPSRWETKKLTLFKASRHAFQSDDKFDQGDGFYEDELSQNGRFHHDNWFDKIGGFNIYVR